MLPGSDVLEAYQTSFQPIGSIIDGRGVDNVTFDVVPVSRQDCLQS